MKSKMKPKKLSQTLFIAIILVLIAFIVIALPLRQIVLAEGKPDDNPSTRISKIINQLNELLANKTLSEDSRKSIELRKQYYEWQANRLVEKTENPELVIAQKQTMAAEATQDYILTTPMPTSSRPIGIMRGIDYVRYLEKEAALSEIYWVGKIKDVYVIVYTGVLRNDQTQGVVFVFPENNGSWLKFLTPDKQGSITITSFEGNRLALLSDQGETFFFDIGTLKFTNSSGDILLTVTNTPYPYPSP